MVFSYVFQAAKIAAASHRTSSQQKPKDYGINTHPRTASHIARSLALLLFRFLLAFEMPPRPDALKTQL
jgi:hypothetical protein